MYRDIDEKNSFIKFEQDPINLKGPKIQGTQMSQFCQAQTLKIFKNEKFE